MDRESIVKQMKAMKKKAQAARAEGKREITAQFQSASARLWRKLKKMAPVVAAKIEGA